jgi:phosphatidylinositol-4,5-bisphosphate 3-kinase
MVPLWLVFKNADPDAPPIFIMFKSGDDLRQDILTLQVLRVMDKLWLREGLDMRLKPYNCIATGINEHGEGVGMIEIVLNSDTTSGIQLKYGGGAMGALKLDPIDSFLRDNNKDKDYSEAVDNFVASCAGYCVATFVLGIGDRHNGNIMVTKDGHLFHIDFGHFLGNFKKKFGVNRERAAFVFTPEMAFVMGGRKYRKHHLFKRFLNLCSKSFAILRQNVAIIENLFVLMTAAGMPELMLQKDVMYIKDKLHLDVNERMADKKLHDEINKSLDSTYRRFDNMIHNFKHG